MTAPVTRLTAPLSRPRRAAAWTLLLTVGACLLAAGCSGGSSGGSGMSGTANGAAAPAAPLPAAHAPGVSSGTNAAGSSGSGTSAGLTSVPVPGGQSVIFTATLSLRADDIQATVAKATQLAQAA